jgi:hypothetical protein
VRATRPARALVLVLSAFDRFWGLIAGLVIVVLEAVVFAPRGMTGWMIGGGIVGAGLFVAWLMGDSSF